MITRPLPAPASTWPPRDVTVSSRAGRWRVCALAAALALAAVYPWRALLGQQSKVHLVWVESGSWVILNTYTLDANGIPTGIAGLLIERHPDRLPSEGVKHELSQTFYATTRSDSLRRLLMEGDSVLVRSVGKTAATAGLSTNPPPLQRPEWSILLDSLEARIGRDEGNLVVERIPSQYRDNLRSELDSLFESGGSPNPVLPYLRGVVLIDGNSRDKTLDFGAVEVGDSTKKSLILKNIGMGRASFVLRINPPSRWFWIVGDTSWTLNPGREATIEIEARPNTLGQATASFSVAGEDGTIVPVTATARAMASDHTPLPWKWIVVGALALLTAAGTTAWGRRRLAKVLVRAAEWLHPPPPLPRPDPHGDRVKLTMAVSSTRDAAQRLEAIAGILETASSAQARHDNLRARVVSLAREPTDAEGASDDELFGSLTTEISGLRGLETSLTEFFPAAGQADPPRRSEALVNAVQELRSDSAKLEAERKSREEAEGQRDEAKGELARVNGKYADLEKSLHDAKKELEQIELKRNKLDGQLKQLQGDHAALTQQHQELNGYRIAIAEMIWLGPDATYPEIQRRFSELAAGLMPAYILKFEQLVVDLRAIFQRVKQQARVEGIENVANAILVGEAGNGGIQLLLGKLKDPAKLLLLLGLERRSDLWHLDRDAFYDRVVSREFKPILDNVARLSLYAGIRKPLDVARKLEEESGIDARLLDRAFGLIELRLEEDFGVQLRTVKLFEEQFQDGKHVSAQYSVIERLLPFVKNAVTDLSQDTIYDITSVGYSSARLNVQPCVSYKMR